MANSRLNMNNELMAKQKSIPSPDSFGNFASNALANTERAATATGIMTGASGFSSNVRKSQPGEEPNDWRVSVIEPSSAKTPATPSEEPGSGKSPDIKLKKFIGIN